MITLKNVQLPDGSRKTFTLNSQETMALDAEHLLALPALVDPHVHFRTPGFEYKEDWRTAAKAALKGGVTTVCDMPNTKPATITLERLLEKQQIINQQLQEVQIPLHYFLYFGADKQHFDELARITKEAVGVKIFMGASTGELLMDDDASLDTAFSLAAKLDLLVAVHAESEEMIRANQKTYAGRSDFSTHSLIRTPAVAAAAVEKAIALSRRYGTKLYILHVSSVAEIELVKAAKAEGLAVFAETCPHYLFLSAEDYPRLNGFAQMNPALRSKHDQAALWQALQTGIIDTIGSDHAPHAVEEKQQAYGCCPSGVPGIETTLPLLYTACRNGQLSLARLVELTRTNPLKLLNLPATDDLVFIDTVNRQEVRNDQLCTKAKWSPFAGMSLLGWPAFITLQNKCYNLQKWGQA